MKPFFGIDLTTDKNNSLINGSEFLVGRPSPALTQALEHSLHKANEITKNSKLPPAFQILQRLCILITIIIICGIIRAGVTVAYNNAPWAFWTAGICLVLWVILKLISIHKSNSVLGNNDNTYTFSHLESVSNSVYADLSVPSDAKDVDVLSFFYKLKNDKIKVRGKGMQLASYLNPVYKIFADSEYLYFANLDEKYAIPLSSLLSIKTVNKHTDTLHWNKAPSLKKEAFKKYKISTNNMGIIICQYYHILEFKHNNTVWGIYFPCYELPAFESVTGLKASQIIH